MSGLDHRALARRVRRIAASRRGRSTERQVLSRLVEALIDRLDALEPDADLEDTHDAEHCVDWPASTPGDPAQVGDADDAEDTHDAEPTWDDLVLYRDVPTSGVHLGGDIGAAP